MRLYAVHRRHHSVQCLPLQPQFRLVEPLPSGQMPRAAYEFIWWLIFEGLLSFDVVSSIHVWS